MPDTIVNINQPINNVLPSYYHCFKLNDSNYALFDIKMDMPIIIASINIIKTILVPQNSYVFYYEITPKFYFEKPSKLYIKIDGDGKHTKSPLRYNYIDKKQIIYHHFRITPVLSVVFDSRFDMPLMYGSNQKVRTVISKIPKEDTVFYYKEDLNVKNSFKLFMTYQGKNSNR